MITIEGKYTTARIMADSGEESALQQIQQMVDSPAITNPVAIMPDFHAGAGAVIGFTMKCGEFVIPNIVGVDIGCGMLSVGVRYLSPDISPQELDARVRKVVPVGFKIHNNSNFDWVSDEQLALAKALGMDESRLVNSVGTLGGGNHFIEFGVDEFGMVWITIHSGSRNFGLQVATHYQKLAASYSGGDPEVVKGLEFLPAEAYLSDMKLAQSYASTNRHHMMHNILHELGLEVLAVQESVHNFIDDDGMIRKGATSAREDEVVIIPMNRTDGIWLMTGKNNPAWNLSAPHGAGRTMSRAGAKRLFTQENEDELIGTSGVYSSVNPVDESPRAYKSPSDIEKYIGETATMVTKIKPFLNIKGG